MNSFYYQIEPAPRANPDRRLDAPWNIVRYSDVLLKRGRMRDGRFALCGRREIVKRCHDRDDAEAQLYSMYKRRGFIDIACGQYQERRFKTDARR